MNSIFKILSNDQWEEAKITGLVPRCAADIEHDCVHVNEFQDLASVCGQFFKPEEYPLALEFAPDSYAADLHWEASTEDKPWREGRLMIDNLLADLVLNIYSFEHEQTSSGTVYRLQGDT